MRLTSFTDYGLRLLMRMAGSPDRSFSTAELARSFGLSRNHVMKIVQHLAHAGIVDTRRGGGGGVTLAHRPDALPLGEWSGSSKTDRGSSNACRQAVVAASLTDAAG